MPLPTPQPTPGGGAATNSNRYDIIFGPVEDYEDQLYGYRTAYEALVLVKDMAWSKALSRFAAFLPELQRGLPVPQEYKQETPGTDSELNAFFNIGMFHEVAHGLGIKRTINDKGYVREALKETYSPLEEGKADILGLYMITRLAEKGEIPEAELLDHYVTYIQGKQVLGL